RSVREGSGETRLRCEGTEEVWRSCRRTGRREQAPSGPAKTIDFIRKPGPLLGPRLGGRRVRHQELAGVLRRAAIAHLEMQVRAGRAPGGAHFADLVAALHDVAFLHVELRLVGVARDEIVAMVDVD